MKEKTKKILQYLSWGLIALGTICLIVLGATAEEISGGVILIDGVIIAMSSAVAYIIGKIKS